MGRIFCPLWLQRERYLVFREGELSRWSPPVSPDVSKQGLHWKELKMRYLFWRIKPDVVHVHWAGFAHPVAQAWSGPLVVTAYGSDIYRLAEQPNNIIEQCVVGLNAAHVITCDSEDLKQRIRELQGRNQNSIHVVQWGVDTEAFFPASPPQPNVRVECHNATSRL